MKALLIFLGVAVAGVVAIIIIRRNQPTTLAQTPVVGTAPSGSLEDAVAGLAVEGAAYLGEKGVEGAVYAAKKTWEGAGYVAGKTGAAAAIAAEKVGDAAGAIKDATGAALRGVGKGAASTAGFVKDVGGAVGGAVSSIFGGGKTQEEATKEARIAQAQKSGVTVDATKSSKEITQQLVDAGVIAGAAKNAEETAKFEATAKANREAAISSGVKGDSGWKTKPAAATSPTVTANRANVTPVATSTVSMNRGGTTATATKATATKATAAPAKPAPPAPAAPPPSLSSELVKSNVSKAPSAGAKLSLSPLGKKAF